MVRPLSDRRSRVGRAVADLVVVAGLGAVVYGVASIHEPTAWIIGGALGAFLGLASGRGGGST